MKKGVCEEKNMCEVVVAVARLLRMVSAGLNERLRVFFFSSVYVQRH